jgi:GTPase SAR1 family protein
VIVVEGPDGAGKSTLVKNLCKDLQLLEGKRSTEDRNKLYETTRVDLYTSLSDEIRGDQPARVWDRSPFFSECVYFPYTGGECRFTDWEKSFILRTIETWGIPVILCLPDFETVKANVAKDKQMPKVEDNISDIYEAYTELPYYTMLWNYTRPSADDNYLEIEDHCQEFLEYRKRRM